MRLLPGVNVRLKEPVRKSSSLVVSSFKELLTLARPVA